MAKFNASKVKTISLGRLEFKQTLGASLDESQGAYRAALVADGYTEEQAEKIVDAVLGQVFGLLGGKDEGGE
jgi:hypothetical protein